MIRYCRNCVMPSTKPDLHFDEEGVCSACRNFQNRRVVDWAMRRRELEEILTRYKNQDGSNYDCLVPVSGGKDSHYQVIKILQMGLNPLCVTATTDELSDIGRRNIENLKSLGVDYIEFSPNPRVRRKMNKLALEQVGDVSWPEHVAIFTIPIRVAVQHGIQLIVWGENSQNEYGGPAAAAQNNTLTRRWLEEFGGLLGLRVSDLVGQQGISERDLIAYTYPADEELTRGGVTGIFLGHYLEWDGFTNALVAQAHGFETWPQCVEGSSVNYENLDNVQTGIHDYFKFLKYGFGRATDLVCMQIRRGRLSREDGIDMVRRHDGHFPWAYLGRPLVQTLGAFDMTFEEFERVCDRFTNKKLFLRDKQGQLLRDNKGNLIKVNYDNLD